MQPVCGSLLLLLPLGRVAAPACNLLPLARSLLCCCCLQLALFCIGLLVLCSRLL